MVQLFFKNAQSNIIKTSLRPDITYTKGGQTVIYEDSF